MLWKYMEAVMSSWKIFGKDGIIPKSDISVKVISRLCTYMRKFRELWGKSCDRKFQVLMQLFPSETLRCPIHSAKPLDTWVENSSGDFSCC